MQTYMNKRKTPDRAAPPVQEAVPSRSEMLHLSGAGAPQPMSPQLREKFEPGFGADFSNIRISRGHIPEEMGVEAVAQGTDILLDEGAGMDVLGHELAHVVQQAQGRVDGGYPVVENAALEQEADVMGERVSSGLTAQAGPQNGFGGESMTIAPMSSASAPAQCKSKEEKQQKKDAKTMQKITDAEQRRDAAIASGANALTARRTFASEMETLVNGMSQRQLQSHAFQDRMVSIAAGPVNSGMRQKAAADDGSMAATDYSLLLRGTEYQPEMKGMNTMAQRLLGKRQMADISKSSAPAAQRIDAAVDQLEANPALRMMKSFKQQIFAGVDHGVMSDDTVQSILMANNYLNRIFGSAGAIQGKPDKAAMNGAIEMQRLAKTEKDTGQFSQNIPQVQRLAALFADPSAQAAAPQPASAQPAPAPVPQPAPPQAAAPPFETEVSDPVYEEVEEPDPTQEMMDRVAQAELNRAIPRELFDEMTDERGHLLDTATIAAQANAASPSYSGMREMFNERRAAQETQMPSYEGVKRIFSEPRVPNPDAETTMDEMLSMFNPKTMPRRDARAATQAREQESFSGTMRSLFDEEAAALRESGLPHAPGMWDDDVVGGFGDYDDLEDEAPGFPHMVSQDLIASPPHPALQAMMNLSDDAENKLMQNVRILDPANDPPPFPAPAPAPAPKKKRWWQFWK